MAARQSRPDGNRRYAAKQNKPPWTGHMEGAKKIEEFMEWCLEYPEIKRISIFALSTENISRSPQEVEALWKVYNLYFQRLLKNEKIRKHGVQVKILGNDGLWRPEIRDVVKEVITATKNYSKMMLNILLAYGSKLEINTAVKSVIKKPIGTIDRFLLVKEPLDLVIRTGQQRRLSNFMLYQASYAEIYFSDTLWPAFTRTEFDKIMDWYHQQQKKFGK